jgi:hypothetical protein
MPDGMLSNNDAKRKSGIQIIEKWLSLEKC